MSKAAWLLLLLASCATNESRANAEYDDLVPAGFEATMAVVVFAMLGVAVWIFVESGRPEKRE